MLPLVITLVLLGPIAAFQIVVRRPTATRGQVVRAAALGGATPALLWVSGVALLAPGSFSGALLSSVPVAAAVGAAIGVAGLLARSLGAWLARRP